jgi:hypothetical protein
MTNYNYPSEYFIYLFCFFVLTGALIVFVRTFKDGYWGSDSEEVKYRMLEDDDNGDQNGRE